MIGMQAAVLLVLQVALRFIPNVEIVSLLIILYTLIFGRKTIYTIYVFVFLEGIVYGIGLWWFNYLYVWLVLYMITLIFHKNNSAFYWAVISGSFGLSFGLLCSIPYFITGGLPSGFAYWVNGILFDLVHGLGNFIAAITLYKPLYYILDKLNKQLQRSS
jgi:energy-coupling factor transport system substrate-specific component